MMLEIILLNREYLAKPVGVLNFNGFRFFCLLGEGVFVCCVREFVFLRPAIRRLLPLVGCLEGDVLFVVLFSYLLTRDFLFVV